MRLDRSRKSRNVEDRRGRHVSGKMIGGGIGTLVILVIAALFGIDPGILDSTAPSSDVMTEAEPPEYDPMRDTVATILGDTEQVWHNEFSRLGRTYVEPTLVLFTGAVESACGYAQAAMGPFYCPMDQKVYLDLSFFEELSDNFGAPGDFARAYVIAHEVGHHVQTLLGISEQVHSLRQQVGQDEANALSVLQELQADCFAGVWARQAHQERQVLEEGDVQEGLSAASAVGDDRLQMETRGYVVPESFTHGSSSQRMEWFMRGLKSGDAEQCDTFSEYQ